MFHIALYQGLPDYHYEMISYALEFALENLPDSKIVLFVHLNHYAVDNVKFNINLFKERFEVKHIGEYKSEDFDVTFLLTDDDPYFPNVPMNKVIVINHYWHVKRYSGIHFINTRNMKTDFPWAIPTFKYIDLPTKLKAIADLKAPVISCVGLSGTAAYEVFIDLLNKYPELQINLIGRHVNQWQADRLHCYRNVPVQTLHDICSKSTHILCFNHGKDFWEIMSGAVPLAFSTGCQLIIPSNWNYPFKSSNSYSNISDMTFSSLETFKSEIIHKVFEDRDNLIKHRNEVFQSTIKKIIS
jgi:hypothetical protein